jgi:hypothetical protein
MFNKSYEFVGLVNPHTCLIQTYYAIVFPLYALKRSNNLYAWSKEQKKCFFHS